MKTQTYIVLVDNHWHNSKRYDKGDEVTFTPREARNRLRAGKIKPKAAPRKAKPKTGEK